MDKWKFSPERLPMYVFPGFLLFIELLLRSAASIDTRAFIGPSLASVGAAYIIPLTIGKERHYPASITKALQQQGLIARPQREIHFIAFCWVATLIFTLLWAVTLYLSAKDANTYWWMFPCHYYPGFFNFFGGIILTEIREVV